MAKILIVYGTTEGQTAKIAEHVADVGRRLGHEVVVGQAGEVDEAELPGCDAVIVGGSLHEGRYQRAVGDFLERNRATLRSLPGAFFSVSLGAASENAAERNEVRRIMSSFVEQSGWGPKFTESFAGALRYTRYSWLKRALMKHIAGKEGGDVDTSRDFEYTDWNQVTRFAESFIASLPAAPK
jgi:menaquinone-dependent protoporphyrinogen oxidase